MILYPDFYCKNIKDVDIEKLRENKEKGITIVSLVITIIILLILATISIQALTNTGLFESANKVKLETKRGQISET